MKVECIARRVPPVGLGQGATGDTPYITCKCRPAKTLLTFTTQPRVFQALRIIPVSRKLTGLRFFYLARHISLPTDAGLGRRIRVKKNNSKFELVARATNGAAFHSRLRLRSNTKRVYKLYAGWANTVSAERVSC